MSVYKNRPDGTTIKRRNKLSEQFAAHPIEMVKSPAWRALTLSARRILDRIAIELAAHGGNDNARLPVTYEQLIEYGLDRHAIAPAIREAVALGFIEVTEQGRGGNREMRRPNLFRITYLNSRGPEPTHEWRRIKTIEDAIRIATAARRASIRKQNFGGGKRHVSVRKIHTETAKSPMGETPTTAVGKTPTTSRISGGRAPRARRGRPPAPQAEGAAAPERVRGAVAGGEPDLPQTTLSGEHSEAGREGPADPARAVLPPRLLSPSCLEHPHADPAVELITTTTTRRQ
jgi:hypothetical protein